MLLLVAIEVSDEGEEVGMKVREGRQGKVNERDQ